jgi:hypothetical protein
MRKLIYISLIALAGCETVLTPQQPTGPSGTDLANYFWHDSTYHYQSSIGTQTILAQGSAITDNNQNGAKTIFSVTVANGAYAMSGFSPSDIFGFDSSLHVVADTTFSPNSWVEAIRSIATASLGGLSQPPKLYAASDSVLYAVDPTSLTLKRLGVFPKSFTLAEDAQNGLLFAYQMGGDSIIWNSGSLWVGDTAPAKITAFTSAAPNGFFDLCWFACGTDVYKITLGSFPQKVASMPYNVVAMTGESNGIVVGLGDGDIYDVFRNGQTHLRQNIPAPLQGIAFVSSVTSDPILAGTSGGVFAIPNSGPAIQVDNGAVSSIFSTGNSIFAGVGVDSVFHYNANGTRYRGYINPNSNSIAQFAHPISAVPSPSYGIYALSGSTIFRLDSDAAGSRWTMINQSVSAPPALQPGLLTLLDSNSTWFAGFVERSAGGAQGGYAYTATSSGPETQVIVNGTTYHNVIVVNYTAKKNGVTDTTDVPQFNIYFEKGVGPAVIEKSENGKMTTTSLAP